VAGPLWVPWAIRRDVAFRPAQSQYLRDHGSLTPTGLVLHTAVSNGTVVVPTGEVRWHFYNNKAGALYQFFPLNVFAACQRDGNKWLKNGKAFGFLSVESWDGAGSSVWRDYKTNPSGGPAWNAAQLATFAKLGSFLHNEWGIELIKATAVQGKGIGQHSDFTAKTGLRWNTEHACVGTKRKAQMDSVRAGMVAQAKKDAQPPAPAPQPKPGGDDEVTPTDIEKIAERTKQLIFGAKVYEWPKGKPITFQQAMFGMTKWDLERAQMKIVMEGVAAILVRLIALETTDQNARDELQLQLTAIRESIARMEEEDTQNPPSLAPSVEENKP